MKKSLLFVFLFVLVFSIPVHARVSGLKIHFVDVGEGDSIVLQSGKDNMIVDFGHVRNYPKLQHYLKKRHIRRFKYSLLTHKHYDHLGGMLQFLNEHSTKKVIMPAHKTDRKEYFDILDFCHQKQIPISYPKKGRSYHLGKAKIQVLHTGIKQAGLNYNNYSTILRVKYGKTCFLLMGDATRAQEKEILKGHIPYQANVVKIAHHGAKSGTSKKFLKRCGCKYAVISTGAENKYGHPNTKALKAMHKMGLKIYRTDKQGTIVLKSNGRRIRWNKQPTKNYKGKSN